MKTIIGNTRNFSYQFDFNGKLLKCTVPSLDYQKVIKFLDNTILAFYYDTETFDVSLFHEGIEVSDKLRNILNNEVLMRYTSVVSFEDFLSSKYVLPFEEIITYDDYDEEKERLEYNTYCDSILVKMEKQISNVLNGLYNIPIKESVIEPEIEYDYFIIVEPYMNEKYGSKVYKINDKSNFYCEELNQAFPLKEMLLLKKEDLLVECNYKQGDVLNYNNINFENYPQDYSEYLKEGDIKIHRIYEHGVVEISVGEDGFQNYVLHAKDFV